METKHLLDIVLNDDDTEFGGLSHAGETLGEFLDEVGLNVNTPIEEVNNALKECGILPIDVNH